MPQFYPPQSSINLLNHLPSLPPSSSSSDPTSQGLKITKLVKKFDDEANTVADLLVDKMPLPHNDTNHLISSPNPNASGEGNRVSAKSELYEICAAYKWNPPCFECWKEEGPPHLRLFSFKVMVEINGGGGGGGGGGMVLECFGEPKPNKTAAAEHVAQGALWYFQHLGFFPINKLGKGANLDRSSNQPIISIL